MREINNLFLEYGNALQIELTFKKCLLFASRKSFLQETLSHGHEKV